MEENAFKRSQGSIDSAKKSVKREKHIKGIKTRTAVRDRLIHELFGKDEKN